MSRSKTPLNPRPPHAHKSRNWMDLGFGRVGAILVTAILIILTIAFFYLPPNRTVIELDAQTETLDFAVTNVAAASFGLEKAQVLIAGQDRGCLSDLTVEPHISARVTYVRALNGKAIITIEGGITITQAEEHARTRHDWYFSSDAPSSLVQFVLNPVSGCIPVSGFVRLPANGNQFEAGRALTYYSDLNNPTLVLLSGHLRVLAQGIGFMGNGPAHKTLGLLQSALQITPYVLFVADEISLEGGSRVRTLSKRESPDWWGFVDLDFQDKFNRGEMVNAWSAARIAEVTLPAEPADETLDENRKNQLRVTLTTAERCMNDPTIRFGAVVYGLLLGILGVLVSIIGGHHGNKP